MRVIPLIPFFPFIPLDVRCTSTDTNPLETRVTGNSREHTNAIARLLFPVLGSRLTHL